MKKKLLAGVLAATLAFTVLPYGALDVTTTQAAVEEDLYYVDGTLHDGNDYTELCTGDRVYVKAGLYQTADDKAVDNDKWDFASDEEVLKALKESGYSGDTYTYYADNEEGYDLIPFTGNIPEEAFGKYVFRFYLININDENGTNALSVDTRSNRTIHSWGGTKNITFESNGDGKTVTTYSIFKNDANNAKIPSKIKVAGKTYKVTSVGDYALENKDIKSVTIPSTVTSIGKSAFNKASKLKTITIQGKLKKVGKSAFAGINKKAVIKIKASASDYKKIVKLIKKAGAPKTVTYKRVK